MIRPVLLVDPSKTTPQEYLAWCTELESLMRPSSNAVAVDEVEPILLRHDRQTPHLAAHRRQLLDRLRAMGYVPRPSNKHEATKGVPRAYLRLLLGSRNLGYVNSIGVDLVDGRRTRTFEQLLADGLIETHNEQGKPHKYPRLDLEQDQALLEVAAEFAKE